MLLKEYTWDFDPYGTNSSNLIEGERHVLTADSGNGFHFFIPKAAPFFRKDLKVVHVGTGRELTIDVDYQLGWSFELATRRTYLPVYAAICVLDKTLNGTFEIQYRTIGGEYTMDESALLTYLSNTLVDPRTTTWESIQDKPLYFAPLEHRFSTDDLTGMSDVITALDRIRDAILQSATESSSTLSIHIRDTNNPHGTNKAHVGLGLVENYAMATDQDAIAGTARNKYMSPATTRALIASLSSESIAGHVANLSNPHQVTKDQVGLGNVENFGVANTTELDAGTAANKYVTVAGVVRMLATRITNALSDHLADRNNPHGVTKAQVQLGNVDNYPTGTNSEYDAGTATNRFTSIAGVTRMIMRLAANALNTHLLDTDNPHQTDKSQIGLSEVPNYGPASDVEAANGMVNNKLMTPANTRTFLEAEHPELTGVSALTHNEYVASPDATTVYTLLATWDGATPALLSVQGIADRPVYVALSTTMDATAFTTEDSVANHGIAQRVNDDNKIEFWAILHTVSATINCSLLSGGWTQVASTAANTNVPTLPTNMTALTIGNRVKEMQAWVQTAITNAASDTTTRFADQATELLQGLYGVVDSTTGYNYKEEFKGPFDSHSTVLDATLQRMTDRFEVNVTLVAEEHLEFGYVLLDLGDVKSGVLSVTINGTQVFQDSSQYQASGWYRFSYLPEPYQSFNLVVDFTSYTATSAVVDATQATVAFYAATDF